MKPIIIDNNFSKYPKSMSVFKNIVIPSSGTGTQNAILEHSLKIKNVTNGNVSYTMIDAPYNVYASSSFGVFEDIIMKVYRAGTQEVILNKKLWDKGTLKKETVYKKVLGSFSYEYPVDVQVDVKLDSGYMRATLDKIDRIVYDSEFPFVFYCWCCTPDNPPPPPTKYVSIFENLDVTINYNIVDGKEKEFYSFKTKHNEFEEGAGIYKYTDEFEVLNDRNYSSVMFALNSNHCVDFSHYEENFVPNPETGLVEDLYPCFRNHIIGNIVDSKVDAIFDNTQGELFEEPTDSGEITESNMQQAQLYFNFDIKNIINGTTEIHSRRIHYFEDDDIIEFLNFNIKIRKDEKKLYVIVEYLARVGLFEKFANDRLRLKSDTSIGCLFLV